MQQEKRTVLAINPGSTSTKFAVYEEEKELFVCNLTHTAEELSSFKRITDQFHFRKVLIMKELKNKGIDLQGIKAIVGRGGLLKPVKSGVYRVDEKMKNDLSSARYGQHASNLGALIADDIASEITSVPAYIVDPVVVDEMQDIAKISGHPLIERRSIFHALNQKAVGRLYAAKVGKRYEDLNLIIAHMGGGISIGAHRKGQVIDVNNALDGDGPFSPERSGGLPAGQLADLCFSGKYSLPEIKSMITGKGGMVAYLGTNNFREVCLAAEKGNEEAKLIRDAVAYQIGKEIGSMASVLKGKIDSIILTGGLAHQSDHVDRIKEMISFIAPVEVFPGEDELKALAMNALLAIDGSIEVRTYS